jgi:hypothetical protein
LYSNEERLAAAKQHLIKAFKKAEKSKVDYQTAFMAREQRENESHALFSRQLDQTV